MSTLHSLMDIFYRAILAENASQVSPSLKTNPRLAPERQLAIYIEGYRIRLTLAVRSDYPALLNLLGEAAFDALARQYIEHNPPSHFSLDRYPHAFAAFMRAHADDAFASDLAELEAAIAEVFMLEESAPLSPSELAGIVPEAFGEMVLKPRLASRLLTCAYPVNDYLESTRSGGAAARPQALRTHLCLVRHGNEVKRHVLSHAQYRLLSQLFGGLPVGAALEAVAREDAGCMPEIASHLQAWFAAWAMDGFFQSLTE